MTSADWKWLRKCSGSQNWKTKPHLSAFLPMCLQFPAALSFPLALSLSPLSILPSFPPPSLRWLALLIWPNMFWFDVTFQLVPAIIYMKYLHLSSFQSLMSHWSFRELHPLWGTVGPSLTWGRRRVKELGEGFSCLKDLRQPLLAVSRVQEVGHAC